MSRKPEQRSRPYDVSEPSGLGNILSSLFAMRGYGRPQANRQLHDIWTKAVELEVASVTKVLGLKNGVLQIGVGNSALASELRSFRREELLEKVRREAGSMAIKDIKFQFRGDLKRR